MVNSKLRGKRKKCAELLAEMAKSMAFPKWSIKMLLESDWTMVSDEHIDMLYKKLVELITDLDPKLMARILHQAKEMQN